MDQDFRYFDLTDYIVFGLLLLASALIGVFFAFCAKQKQNTTSEYLMGGKKMGIFPISMSLMASYISGISILGLPSEMYIYGTQLWVLMFAELCTAIGMSIAYIPVFYKLQITSSYEYLNRRFNPACRTLGSVIFLFKMMLYIPIVIYVPALAFAQVTGFSLEKLIPSVCAVCIFYTTLGGIKAVVWTDTLQMILMVLGVISVSALGTQDVGGFDKIIEINQKGERIDFFNLSLDPTVRHTFWNVLFGKFFHHMASCTINQAMVQRCLAMPTLTKARITIGIFAIGIMGMVSMCCYTGLVIYAAFADCDPVTTGTIGKADQLLPYFVMKITSHVPALPGIFVSGVFSAALSTMSTGLNSMCGVILEDFIRPLVKKPLTEGQASFYMKVITVVLGVICVLLAFVVDRLGGLIQASGSLSGITAGTLLGMFTLGMFFPWANSTGAITGGVVGAALVSWISIGSQVAIHNKQLIFPTKPTSIEGCDNVTLNQFFRLSRDLPGPTPPLPLEQPFPLYTISYLFYTPIGLFTSIIVGMIVSYFTGFNDPHDMDPDLFSPIIKGWLKRKQLAKIKWNRDSSLVWGKVMESNAEIKFFDVVDYVVFIGLLAASALIGVYFAFCAKQKQNSTLEYLLGGKKMGIFPISMSLIASYTSGIALLGFPSEMYQFGSQLALVIFTDIASAIIMSIVYIPVFYNLQITSSYEYLNRRFNPAVRTVGSVFFLLKMLLYIPIVIYGPALAFSQVSGFSLNWLIPATTIVCIFYTTLGGIKAVVWTDTLQMLLMIVSLLAIIILGTISVGGFGVVYEKNKESGRLDIDFSWDPTIRHTFWNIMIGKFFSHTAVCTINQAMVQRCLAMPTLKKARFTIAIFAIGTFFLTVISCYSGQLVYAAFSECDPVSTKQISKSDQLLPYFVMKTANLIPGYPGLFVSGIFSAALSTLSTGLNSMCGVILEDFIRPCCKNPLSEAKASYYMKIITVILGVICIFLTFIVDRLGTLIQVAGSFGGITGGTLLGMFTLGMLFPWANSTGAIVGGISGAGLVTWMVVGQQLALIRKEIVFPLKPVSVEGCANTTVIYSPIQASPAFEKQDALLPLYSISYVYYTVIGMVTVLVVGNLVSCLTGFTDPMDLDGDVFSPVIKPFLKTKRLKARMEKVQNLGVKASITRVQHIPLIKN